MSSSSAPQPVVLIRNSERSTYKRCQQMWWWNFVDLLKPLEEGKALRFGDLVHRSLEGHYLPGVKRGPKPHIVFEKLYKEQLKDGRANLNMVAEERGWLDAGELGVGMMRNFYDEFANIDAAYEVIASEQVFQVLLPLSFARRKFLRSLIKKPIPKIIVVGTMDGLWKPRTGPKLKQLPFIKEWKTSGKGFNDVLAALPMDEQAGTYWTFGPIWMWQNGILPEKTYPHFIRYTLLAKRLKDERPQDDEGHKLNKPAKGVLVDEYKRRKKQEPPKGSNVDSLIQLLGPSSLKLGEISAKQPPPLFARQDVYRSAAERRAMWERCQDEAVDMILRREGIMNVVKNPGPQWQSNCKNCSFRDPCEVHESGGDYESVFRALYSHWKPYSAHEMPERW